MKRSEILRGHESFRDVFQHGRKIEGNLLRCLISSKADNSKKPQKRILVGFAVSRNIKRAVDRNRLKRLMREAFRLNRAMLNPESVVLPRDLHVIFLYVPRRDKSTDDVSYHDIEKDMRPLLKLIPLQKPE